MTAGRTIRYLRTASRVSQSNLAKKLGVTASYLSLVEHDKRDPSLKFLRGVSRCFAVPVGFLLLQQEPEVSLQRPQRKLLNDIRRWLIEYIIERERIVTRERPARPRKK